MDRVINRKALGFIAMFTIAVLFVSSTAKADFYTQLAEWNNSISNVQNIVAPGGAVYSNTVTAGPNPNVLDQSTFHAIYGIEVFRVQNPGNQNPGGANGFNIVGAIKGFQVADNPNIVGDPNVTATFTDGFLAIVPATGGSFETWNPSTWNLDTVNNNALWIGQLKPPELALPGAGFPLTPTFIDNQVTANLAVNSELEGRSLFREILDANGFLDVTTFLDGPGGNPLQNIVSADNVFAEFDETIVTAGSGQGFDLTDLTTANAIFDFFYSGEQFASGINGGGVTDFNALGNGVVAGSPGDFAASLDSNIRPGTQVGIPEPTSVLIWTVIGSLAVAGFVRSRRRSLGKSK